MHKPLQTGDVVTVREWSQENGWQEQRARVVRPQYMAGDPSLEWVGEMLTGRFAGKTLALQTRHVRGLGDEM